ncbi:sigma factor-like helix-turn-helix DNA-binding protein [Nocardia salmonicida]|uniref:sigma factor-like helix-turn-helix DNA-binding protein n=1 Tax=Nocardia salmonicida TaxID=53431 RepID=UPI0034242ECE
MATEDEFDAIRNDPDPISQGLRASELIAVYQQRSTELARLRKVAIERAYREYGLSYTEISERLGLTKSRVSQIRSSAPPPERAFFGVGPVAVGVPRRIGLEEGRERPYVDDNDRATLESLQRTLADLAFTTTQFDIDPEFDEVPSGDCIIVCGPKSAPIARRLLEEDPILGFDRSERGWSIVDNRLDRQYYSPYRTDGQRRDIGYLSRRITDRRVVVHIAGITAVGSEGVAHWLSGNLATVYDPNVEMTDCVIGCEFDADFSVTSSELVAGPYSEPQ